MYFELSFVKRLMTFSRKLFPKVAYGYAVTPSYAPGHIGFLLCSTNPVSYNVSTKNIKILFIEAASNISFRF